MSNEIIQQAVGVGGGIIGGGTLVLWMAKRYISKVDDLIKVVYTLAASFEAWKRVPEENRLDIKLHDRKITMVEASAKRSHERIDEMQQSKH